MESTNARGRPPGDTAPPRLVESGQMIFGSWTGFPDEANMLDAERPYKYRIPNFMKRMRLKEWRALQAGDEDWFIFAVLYDAKFVSMASIDIWDRKNQKKTSFRTMFPLSKFIISKSLEFSETHADTSSHQLSIRIDPEASFVGLHAASAPTKSNLSSLFLDLRFDFSVTSSTPISVCMPLGLNRGIYSTKVLLPCSGTLVIDGVRHEFDPKKATGAFDDHKGYYPYNLHYDWVTGFGIDPSGRRVGFNLTDNQVKDQATYNENRLWIDRSVYSLPPVKITRPNGKMAAWSIQDTNGTVDMRFYPEVHNDMTMKLGIAKIDYAGPFGHFDGRISAVDGNIVDVAGTFGMGEDKNVRL
jgi:hypothetical protein